MDLNLILKGQTLEKAKDFPKVVEKSKDYLRIVVDGIPDGFVTTAYFRPSWENGKVYNLSMDGNSVTIDEYLTTLPQNTSEYVDYILGVSVVGVNADGSRFTTNIVDIILDKTAYSAETENTPEIPQSQYEALIGTVVSSIVSDVENIEKTLYGEPETIKEIRNTFNPDDEDVVLGKFIDYVDDKGAQGIVPHWTTNAAWNESGYIPVTGKRLFIYLTEAKAYNKSVVVILYDDAKTCLGNITFTAYNHFEIPDGVAYVRIPWKEERRAATLVFFTDETDTVTTPSGGFEYVPYGEVVLTFEVAAAKQGLVKDVEDLKIAGVPSNSASHWNGLKWYAYGTSLTSTAQGKYAPYVAEMSGLILTNKGIQGGGIISNTQVKDAVMNTTDGKLDADLITLEVGANDMSAVLGAIYDTGEDTFCGALNQCIRYLQANTTAQIVVISSTNSKTNPPENEVGTDKHTKYDQWCAIENVCRVNSVPYIPMGESAGLGYARMTTDYLVDNIHHTQLGGYNLAQFVWSRLQNIPKWHIEIV